MADFNINALGAFRNIDFGNADAIVNIKQGGGVGQNGKLGNFFCKMFRSSATEARNNAVRTELLRALGQGFGIEGMTEKDGKTYFSADFMAKLERILGRDVFKAADFKLNRDGSVSSGKPLTQRRIQAIVAKAGIYANTGFSVGAYRQKLESIKKDLGIAGLSGAQLDALNKNEKTPSMTKLFIHVAKSLDFLEGLEFGKPALDKKTGKPLGYYTYSKNEDTSFIRLDPTLGFKLELGDDVSKWRDNRFQFRMPGSKEGDYQPLNGNLGDFEHGFNHQLFLALGGELIHTERAHFDSSGTDIEPLKKYIAQTIQLFAQKMVDVYLECKAEGKMDAFRAHCENPGACMEEKGLQLTKFEEEHLAPPAQEGTGLTKAEVAELERIANQAVGDNAPPDKSEDLLYGVIDALNQGDEKLNASENWADFSAAAKEKLVGKTAKIVVPFKNEETGFYEFKPLVVDGKEVVRPLTAEDVDTIGKACLFNSVNI